MKITKKPFVWFENRIGVDVIQYTKKENKIYFLTSANIKPFYQSQFKPVNYRYEVYKYLNYPIKTNE